MKILSQTLITGFILLVMMNGSVLAQSKTMVGASAGGTAADFNYVEDISNPDYESQKKTGFNGGIKVDVPLVKSGILKLTPEVFINQNGTKDEYYTSYQAFFDTLSKNKISLDYIGLYLPAKLNIQSKQTGSGIYIIGAIYADYTIAARVASNVAFNPSMDEKVTFQDTKDRLDWGVRGAFGLLFSENAGLEIGYNYGVKEIEFATKLNSSNTTYIVNNRGLTISFVTLL